MQRINGSNCLVSQRSTYILQNNLVQGSKRCMNCVIRSGNKRGKPPHKDKKVLRFANMLPYPLPTLSQKHVTISFTYTVPKTNRKSPLINSACLGWNGIYIQYSMPGLRAQKSTYTVSGISI